jgi:hypothetical protein
MAEAERVSYKGLIDIESGELVVRLLFAQTNALAQVHD